MGFGGGEGKEDPPNSHRHVCSLALGHQSKGVAWALMMLMHGDGHEPHDARGSPGVPAAREDNQGALFMLDGQPVGVLIMTDKVSNSTMLKMALNYGIQYGE